MVDFIKATSVYGNKRLIRLVKDKVVSWSIADTSYGAGVEVIEVSMANGVLYHIEMTMADFDVEMGK